MFAKRKSQIIKFEQNLCNAKVDDNKVLFVRVDDVVTSADARFEVPRTHTAIVIKGGGDMRHYDSGTYYVFDDKKEIKNWKSGLSLDIIYIPKITRVKIDWGTPNRFRYRDEASNKVITVGAHGFFDVSVLNPEQFYLKVVGSKREFDLEEFSKRFGDIVSVRFVDVFLKVVKERHLTYDEFDTNKGEIGKDIGKILGVEFEKDWGLSIQHFEIKEAKPLDSDMDAIEDAAAEKQRQEKRKEYLAELERLGDKEWEREKYLRQLELQDREAYYEVLKVIGSDKKRAADKDKEKEPPKCPNCHKEYSPSDKFCPHCGARVSTEPIICSNCGKSNASTSVFCANCGKKLIGE